MSLVPDCGRQVKRSRGVRQPDRPRITPILKYWIHIMFIHLFFYIFPVSLYISLVNRFVTLFLTRNAFCDKLIGSIRICFFREILFKCDFLRATNKVSSSYEKHFRKQRNRMDRFFFQNLIGYNYIFICITRDKLLLMKLTYTYSNLYIDTIIY